MAHEKGNGVGTKLCKDVFDYAQSKGYALVTVTTQSNQPAAKFYQRFGQKFADLYGMHKELNGYEGQSEVVAFRWTLKRNLEEPGFTSSASSIAGTSNKVDDGLIERLCKNATEIMKIGRTPRCAVIVGRCGEKPIEWPFPRKKSLEWVSLRITNWHIALGR